MSTSSDNLGRTSVISRHQCVDLHSLPCYPQMTNIHSSFLTATMRHDDNQWGCYPLWVSIANARQFCSAIADGKNQNSAEATFSRCILPCIASVPGCVIVLIGIKCMLSGRYFYKWRPTWTQPFVLEDDITDDEISSNTRRQTLHNAGAIFVVTVLGFIAEIVQLIMTPFFGYILLASAWVSNLSLKTPSLL